MSTNTQRRFEKEEETVRTLMPENTRRVRTPDGWEGWMYSFICEFEICYRMFAFFDGQFYQVSVSEPKLEARYKSPHKAHIFPTGLICLGTGFNGGRPTLAAAYAKSVFWANGVSAMLAGNLETFPFDPGELKVANEVRNRM